MSLDSYLQELESQRKVKRDFDSETNRKSQEDNNRREKIVYLSESPVKSHSRFKRFITIPLMMIIGFLFVLALVKNPSPIESQELIKLTAIQHINKYLERQSEETNNGWEKFGFGLARLLAPTAYDAMVQTEIEDYVVYTKFSASFNLGDEPRYVKGIILFGKVIPLETNIPEFSSAMTNED